MNASLEESVNGGQDENSDQHGNTDQHPKHIKLNERSHEPNTIITETLNSDIGNSHTGSYSVPVTPVKPYQSSDKSSDHHKHYSMLPRRSHSYEHLEELGLSPLASSLPPHQSVSQSVIGGVRLRGNILASVGSSGDVLGE